MREKSNEEEEEEETVEAAICVLAQSYAPRFMKS